jgi:hypothetical protein
MSNKNLDLYEEAIDYLISYYQGARLFDDEDAQEIVDDLYGLAVKRLVEKIKQCDKDMVAPTVTMEECGWDCLESKKKAFKEVISMLGGVKKTV